MKKKPHDFHSHFVMQQQEHLNQTRVRDSGGSPFIGFAMWVPCAGLVKGGFAAHAWPSVAVRSERLVLILHFRI